MDALRQAIEARKRLKLGQEEETSSSSSSEEEEEQEEEKPVNNEKQDDSALKNTQELVVIQWLEQVLADWLEELSHREFKTASERQVLATARECETQLAPLLALLRARQIDQAMLSQLETIVLHCKEREYRKAYDHYLQLTIGNAAWPIGVTMVGIHARSGREKIAEDKIQHLMKNETARAYMMSVKRLMTRHQAVFPPSAPSKSMN